MFCSGADEPAKWYKFDDGEVTECKMDDDEEMKSQCFGGDYVGEVFDHMLKRLALWIAILGSRPFSPLQHPNPRILDYKNYLKLY